jgi:hypothetical protein
VNFMIGKCGSEGNDRFRALTLNEFISSCIEPSCNYKKYCENNGYHCIECYEEYMSSLRR